MKKALYYIPAIVFTVFCVFIALMGYGITLRVIGWLALFWFSVFMLNKNQLWGTLLGLLPAINLIYMGTQETGQIFNEMPIGIVVLLFYVICGFLVFRKAHSN